MIEPNILGNMAGHRVIGEVSGIEFSGTGKG